jgi:hypothetical protein
MASKSTQPRQAELEGILKSLKEKTDTKYNSLLIAIDFGTTHSGWVDISKLIRDFNF